MWRTSKSILIVAKNLTAESLNRLLAEFSEDQRQAAAAYTNLRDSLIRFFTLKGDSEPEAAADETLDRTAAKLTANTPVENITKYSFGVARLIFLERLRLARKEKNAANFYAKKNALANDDEETDDFQFFRDCFRGLTAAERNFLQSYFADLPFKGLNELRHRLTEETGVSIEQMRVKIFRLRKRLENCVRQKTRK